MDTLAATEQYFDPGLGISGSFNHMVQTTVTVVCIISHCSVTSWPHYECGLVLKHLNTTETISEKSTIIQCLDIKEGIENF